MIRCSQSAFNVLTSCSRQEGQPLSDADERRSLPPTEQERLERLVRELLTSAGAEGMYRREVILLGRENGFAERRLSETASRLGVEKIRQGRRPSIWRLPQGASAP